MSDESQAIALPKMVSDQALTWRNGQPPEIVAELDQKPALAFLLHLRAFISLIREILSR
ncbi:hypothetical protein [uncultured Bosea sp.]|uniref:hypothetical protein n=1 Tax=uncultured Bosea sp. TaxID=211457 RepID=UPI00263AEEF6|nr:hypothetical protein [uncultured Bosea sp.]